MRLVVLLLFPILLAAGQVLFKKAALAIAPGSWQSIVLNGWMAAALLFYVAATGLWVWILRTAPLSAAYPFAALSFVLVPVGAMLLFGESLGWRYAAGAALIVAGVAVTSS